MEPNRVNRALKKSLAQAAIEKHIRVDDLRRTAASIMAQQGANPTALQEILGHATIAVTMDIYVNAN